MAKGQKRSNREAKKPKKTPAERTKAGDTAGVSRPETAYRAEMRKK